jgi:hypothetical protein
MGRRPLALGIGQKTADRRGVLLYFDLTHRKMKGEVGYGLEGVLVAQGDGPGALVAYVKSLDIAEALAARDPANTQWQGKSFGLGHRGTSR